MGLLPKRPSMRTLATAATVYAGAYGSVHLRRRLRCCPLVAYASSGAGSHVFSALGVARELRNHGVGAVFLAESRGLEVHVVPQYGFVLHCVSSVELHRPLKSVTNAIKTLLFPLCVAHSGWVLVRTAPDVVVGLGGRVALPACLAAAALGIPVLVYEPNATSGRVTQVMSVLARRTLLAYDTAAAGLLCKDRCVLVGPAVRQEVLGSAADGPEERQRQRKRAREALGVPGRGSRLLVVLGGAKGSGYLNCAVNNALPQLTAVPGLHILWQTGARQYVAYSAGHATSLSKYGTARYGVHCQPFLHDMGTVLAAADLVLSRAGASTVADLAATGTPAVLVPSPAVSEEQQAANARVLADAGLAELVPQAEVDDHGLAPRLLPLLAPESKRLAGMRAAWSTAIAGTAVAGTGTGAGACAGADEGPQGVAAGPSSGRGGPAARSGACRPGRGSVACIRDEVLYHVGQSGCGPGCFCKGKQREPG